MVAARRVARACRGADHAGRGISGRSRRGARPRRGAALAVAWRGGRRGRARSRLSARSPRPRQPLAARRSRAPRRPVAAVIGFKNMPSAIDDLITRLQADCTAAETAERTVRASVDAQIKAAEQARAFAWRRLNALSDMARAAAREPEREASIQGQLVALLREVGW